MQGSFHGNDRPSPPAALTLALVLFGLALALPSPTLIAANSAPKKSPNVLVILTDDMRWDALSCAEHPILKTPHLDRLAKEGARFANAFVTTSLCSPSRASLLSGQYARTHGVLNNFTEFPASLASYPRQLQDAGYQTAYIGKWHMGETNDAPRPGFHFWMSHRGQGKYFDNEFNVNGDRKNFPGYYTTVVTDAAIQWIQNQRSDQPFLLVLGHKAPHGGPIEPDPALAHALDEFPIKPPRNALDYSRPDKPEWLRQSFPTWHGAGGPLYGLKTHEAFVRAYLATLLSVDASVGRLYNTLKSAGFLDDTVILFTSDNGFVLGEHGRVDKRTAYEPSIRVPLLVRYPPAVPAGRVISQMVLNIDLAPSILDLCKASPLPNTQGRSWRPLLHGLKIAGRQSFLYEYNYETEFPYTPNVRAVRTPEWKLIQYPQPGAAPSLHASELYHLKSDPLERTNLYSLPAHRKQARKLEKELQELSRRIGPETLPPDGGIRNVLPRF